MSKAHPLNEGAGDHPLREKVLETRLQEANLEGKLLALEHEGRPSQGRPTGKGIPGSGPRGRGHAYSTTSLSRKARRRLDAKNKKGAEHP